ncbi:MAG: uncharacterized protein KVP18_001909 [Porospora cf. gigantea A]|uniref:uncharacterized protein n=1 Tax=Porospora cf. gigantea A TaxID=2853593 RepID=UPI0035599E81|nr:MAG: hypothetical protein KVP18_001909 [Porospora cf. gigantea A]
MSAGLFDIDETVLPSKSPDEPGGDAEAGGVTDQEEDVPGNDDFTDFIDDEEDERFQDTGAMDEDEWEDAERRRRREEENQAINMIQRDVIAHCNEIRIGEDPSQTRLLVDSDQVETSVSDIVTLLNQEDRDGEGVPRRTVEMTLLNSHYRLLPVVILPLWSLAARAGNFRMMGLLAVVLHRVLLPGTEQWRCRRTQSQMKEYLLWIQEAKRFMGSDPFWSAFKTFEDHLLTERENGGLDAQTATDLRVLRVALDQLATSNQQPVEWAQELAFLISPAIHDASPESALEKFEKMSAARKLSCLKECIALREQKGRERNREVLQLLLMLRVLMASVLGIRPPAPAVCFTRYNCQDIHCTMVKSLLRHGLFSIIDADAADLLRREAHVRTNRSLLNNAGCSDSESLWRIVNCYFHVICRLEPGALVKRHLRVSRPPMQMPVQIPRYAGRHSRMNPELMRKRMQAEKGSMHAASATDKCRAPRVYSERFKWSDCCEFTDVHHTTVSNDREASADYFLGVFTDDEIKSLFCLINSFLCRVFVPLWPGLLDDLKHGDVLVYDKLRLFALQAWFLAFVRAYLMVTGQSPSDAATHHNEVLASVYRMKQFLSTAVIRLVVLNVRTLYTQAASEKAAAAGRTLCRLLHEQVSFAAFLMEFPQEQLKLTGRTVVRFLYEQHVHRVLRVLVGRHASSHDPEVLHLAFDILRIMGQSLESTNPIIIPLSVQEGSRRRDDSTEVVDLSKWRSLLTDGRAVHWLVRLASDFKVNSPAVNSCVTKLLEEIVTAHVSNCVALFRVSYLCVWNAIAWDTTLRGPNIAIKRFAERVLRKFWEIFAVNKFVVIEGFFANGTEDLNTELLSAIISGYPNEPCRTSSSSQQASSRLQQTQKEAASQWNPTEDRTLLQAWHSVRAQQGAARRPGRIKAGMDSRRPTKQIIQRLVELRIYDDLTRESPAALSLLEAVVGLLKDSLARCFRPGTLATEPGQQALSGFVELLTTWAAMRSVSDDAIVVEPPAGFDVGLLENGAFCMLMDTMGFAPPDESNPLWTIPGMVDAETLKTFHRDLKKWSAVPLHELEDRLRDLQGNRQQRFPDEDSLREHLGHLSFFCQNRGFDIQGVCLDSLMKSLETGVTARVRQILTGRIAPTKFSIKVSRYPEVVLGQRNVLEALGCAVANLECVIPDWLSVEALDKGRLIIEKFKPRRRPPRHEETEEAPVGEHLNAKAAFKIAKKYFQFRTETDAISQLSVARGLYQVITSLQSWCLSGQQEDHLIQMSGREGRE